MNWSVCESCSGTGKKKQKKSKRKNQSQVASTDVQHEPSGNTIIVTDPVFNNCNKCEGKGIIPSLCFPKPDPDKFPHVAIIGLGIGGITLAVACLHRGIPFSIFERDASFSARSQGYGLTLQQASRITKALGITSFDKGVVSTRHIVHDTLGNVLGSWGKRKWIPEDTEKQAKKTNIHISRQELRLSLLKQLDNENQVYWNHQFLSFDSDINQGNILRFLVDGEEKIIKADLIVGADGIRSQVRNQLLEGKDNALHYLGCLVILGICHLQSLQQLDTDLLDSATVFQTANGNERIYMMPYSKEEVMWQLSFPIEEVEAVSLSKQGAKSLKEEAIKRTQWHSPIPEIILTTNEELITGYPVYDRQVLDNELTELNKPITLIGDAMHPMSPFKGQGANQAMLDGLVLARSIYVKYKSRGFDKSAIRTDVLTTFEAEMITRSSVKVKESARAAEFLHSIDVLDTSDQPRRKMEG